MAASKQFLTEMQHVNWKTAIEKYNDILKEKAKKKTKPSSTKELIELDTWFQNELPKTVCGREDRHITQEELVKLMKWKLARGKFRPRLVELAGSNADSDVIAKTKAAFKKAASGDIKAAINALTPLKGIGPATASAILVVGCPEEAAFMADEPTVAILGAGGLKYNLEEYMAYMDGINGCALKLKEQAPEFGWTAHKVELALWTHCQATALGIPLENSAESEPNSADKQPKSAEEQQKSDLKRKTKENTSKSKKQKK